MVPGQQCSGVTEDEGSAFVEGSSIEGSQLNGPGSGEAGGGVQEHPPLLPGLHEESSHAWPQAVGPRDEGLKPVKPEATMTLSPFKLTSLGMLSQRQKAN